MGGSYALPATYPEDLRAGTATSFITAYPLPRLEGRRVAWCIHARGEIVVQAMLSCFIHQQRKVPQERYLKSADSASLDETQPKEGRI
jgi:hypothetical protein